MTSVIADSTNSNLNLSHPRMIRLFRQAHRYSLFQAIRDIESVADHLPRVGHATSPASEAVRIQQTPDLGFAPTTIRSAWRNAEGSVAVEQSAFGMLGPSGALPIHLTELVRNRSRQAHDHATKAFVDIFHHRLAELFYRAWSCSRPAVQRDRPWDDRFSRYVASLAGYGLKNSNHRDRWPDESKWFFSGRLASIRRNSEGLEAIVGRTTGARAEVLPFQLQRLAIPSSDYSRLGRSTAKLGENSLLGRKVADRQSLIELRVGPLEYPKFQQLMPDKPKRRALESTIRNYVGLGIDTRLRLILSKKTTPRLQLGHSGTLGRNAWIQSQPPKHDLDDCVLQVSPS